MRINIITILIIGLLTSCGGSDLKSEWCKCNKLKLKIYQEQSGQGLDLLADGVIDNLPTDSEIESKYGVQLDTCKAIEQRFFVEEKKKGLKRKDLINECSAAQSLDMLRANGILN